MRIRPKEDYKLLGTSVVLDKNKVYPASIATNLPNYKQKESIFVHYDDHGGAMLLNKGEYTKTKDKCLTKDKQNEQL
jgi:hypothetical protein